MATCTQHGVDTNLSCRTCGTPVCGDCSVRTAMGIACREHVAGAKKDAVVATAPRREPSGGGRRLVVGGVALALVAAAVVFLRPSGGGDGDTPVGAWTSLPAAGLAARGDLTSVWTGKALLVWGGNGQAGPLDDGAAFDVPTSTWTPMAAAPIVGRRSHSAVWAGDRMIVFGGLGRPPGCARNCALADGASYDPVTNRWAPIAASPLTPRSGHTAAWVQNRMVVWGGAGEGGAALADGASYDPATDRWTTLPAAPLEPRTNHRTVATTHRMLVWGGSSEVVEGGRYLADGAIYSPATNEWTPMAPYPETRVDPARDTFSSVWTGEKMLVWGGFGRTESCRPCLLDDGAAYDLNSNSWTLMSPSPLAGRGAHRAVWTGRQMVVWGGFSTTELNDGAAYNPASDTWTPLARSPLLPRQQQAMVWAGEQLVVWGGHGPHGEGAGATANHDDGAILRLNG